MAGTLINIRGLYDDFEVHHAALDNLLSEKEGNDAIAPTEEMNTLAAQAKFREQDGALVNAIQTKKDNKAKAEAKKEAEASETVREACTKLADDKAKEKAANKAAAKMARLDVSYDEAIDALKQVRELFNTQTIFIKNWLTVRKLEIDYADALMETAEVTCAETGALDPTKAAILEDNRKAKKKEFLTARRGLNTKIEEILNKNPTLDVAPPLTEPREKEAEEKATTTAKKKATQEEETEKAAKETAAAKNAQAEAAEKAAKEAVDAKKAAEEAASKKAEEEAPVAENKYEKFAGEEGVKRTAEVAANYIRETFGKPRVAGVTTEEAVREANEEEIDAEKHLKSPFESGGVRSSPIAKVSSELTSRSLESEEDESVAQYMVNKSVKSTQLKKSEEINLLFEHVDYKLKLEQQKNVRDIARGATYKAGKKLFGSMPQSKGFARLNIPFKHMVNKLFNKNGKAAKIRREAEADADKIKLLKESVLSEKVFIQAAVNESMEQQFGELQQVRDLAKLKLSDSACVKRGSGRSMLIARFVSVEKGVRGSNLLKQLDYIVKNCMELVEEIAEHEDICDRESEDFNKNEASRLVDHLLQSYINKVIISTEQVDALGHLKNSGINCMELLEMLLKVLHRKSET